MGCLERQSHTGAWTHDTTQHKKLSDLPPGINLFEHSQRWSLEAAHIQSRSYNSCAADPSSLASIVNAAQRQAMDLHIGFSTCECLAVEPGSFCGRSTCAMKGYGPSLSNIVSFLYLPVVGRPDGTLRLWRNDLVPETENGSVCLEPASQSEANPTSTYAKHPSSSLLPHLMHDSFINLNKFELWELSSHSRNFLVSNWYAVACVRTLEKPWEKTKELRWMPHGLWSSWAMDLQGFRDVTHNFAKWELKQPQLYQAAGLDNVFYSLIPQQEWTMNFSC